MFPWNDKKCGGYVRMRSSCEKKCSRSASTIVSVNHQIQMNFQSIDSFHIFSLQHFVILLGKVELLAASTVTEFNSGSMITIPKGKNFQRFHSI